MSAGAVRELLARHGLAPNRDLGQNFLVDASLADRLVTLSGVGPEDAVIEVGTGLGVMTRALAARARRVRTIELDAGLVRALGAEGLLPANAELRHADVLSVDLGAMAEELGAPVQLVGNLPYGLSSPLLRRLLDLRTRLCGWSVMLQQELAARLVAAPGTRDYGSLTVLHRLCVDVEPGMELRPGCFFPAPRVHSAFLRMRPRPEGAPDPAELRTVERVVRAAFAARRKTLWNTLRAGLPEIDPGRIEAALRTTGLAPELRAERVDPETFRALAAAIGASR